jgi:hypothetical protein
MTNLSTIYGITLEHVALAGYFLIDPQSMLLDDTDTNVSKESAFGIIPTVDFGPTTDGSAYVTKHLFTYLDSASDVKLDLYYNLDGADNSKNVRFQTIY